MVKLFTFLLTISISFSAPFSVKASKTLSDGSIVISPKEITRIETIIQLQDIKIESLIENNNDLEKLVSIKQSKLTSALTYYKDLLGKKDNLLKNQEGLINSYEKKSKLNSEIFNLQETKINLLEGSNKTLVSTLEAVTKGMKEEKRKNFLQKIARTFERVGDLALMLAVKELIDK